MSNATDDIISVIDWRSHKLLPDIILKADPLLDHYRGLMPFGLCLSPDEATLYVALLGFNAVAVVDTRTGRTRGFIPTGWGTTRVVQSEGYLYITSARGYGAGPNGGRGFHSPPQGTYIGDIQLGTFQKVPVPDSVTLGRYTAQVLSNTFPFGACCRRRRCQSPTAAATSAAAVPSNTSCTSPRRTGPTDEAMQGKLAGLAPLETRRSPGSESIRRSCSTGP